MDSFSLPPRFPAAVVTGDGRIEAVEVPGFALGDYDCLCRIEACSICAATDSHLVDGSFVPAWRPAPPFVLGHESAGRVLAVGPKVRNFRVGDLVVRPMWWPDQERVGDFGKAWGGFAAYGLVRDVRAQRLDGMGETQNWWNNSLVLPEMPIRDATLFVTWRDCLSCLMQLKVGAGHKIAVWGSGGNGLAFVRFATLLGAEAVLVGNPARFARAEALGARASVDYRAPDVAHQVREALGGGADVAVEAAGTASSLAAMQASLAPDGALYLFGLPGDLNYAANLYNGPSSWRIVRKDCDEWQAHDECVAFYQAGQLRATNFCDGQAPLAEIGAAFESIRRREAAKICILLPEGME